VGTAIMLPCPYPACPPKDFETARKTNKDYGRMETRRRTLRSQLKDILDWPDLERVFKFMNILQVSKVT